MKLKTLKKKIGRLEARLQDGAKKLAKLKRKLSAATTAGGKTKKKSGGGAGRALQSAKSSTSAQKKKSRSAAKAQVKPAATRQGAAKKVKKKLNLSPERRAQLAAAMKARWAAKRAAADASPQDSNRDFTLGPNPQGA